jgi:predicted nucleic acid-binding protein
MRVLVDSSVWIDYFRAGTNDDRLDELIDTNLVATNDLILTELVPFLLLRGQRRIVELLNTVERIALTIDWAQLTQWQYRCLKQGLNGIGIPDLIIAQNTVQHRCRLYSLDAHFVSLRDIIDIGLYP